MIIRVRNTETLDSRPTEYSVIKFSAEKFVVSVEYRDSEKSSNVNDFKDIIYYSNQSYSLLIDLIQ